MTHSCTLSCLAPCPVHFWNLSNQCIAFKCLQSSILASFITSRILDGYCGVSQLVSTVWWQSLIHFKKWHVIRYSRRTATQWWCFLYFSTVIIKLTQTKILRNRWLIEHWTRCRGCMRPLRRLDVVIRPGWTRWLTCELAVDWQTLLWSGVRRYRYGIIHIWTQVRDGGLRCRCRQSKFFRWFFYKNVKKKENK